MKYISAKMLNGHEGFMWKSVISVIAYKIDISRGYLLLGIYSGILCNFSKVISFKIWVFIQTLSEGLISIMVLFGTS